MPQWRLLFFWCLRFLRTTQQRRQAKRRRMSLPLPSSRQASPPTSNQILLKCRPCDTSTSRESLAGDPPQPAGQSTRIGRRGQLHSQGRVVPGIFLLASDADISNQSHGLSARREHFRRLQPQQISGTGGGFWRLWQQQGDAAVHQRWRNIQPFARGGCGWQRPYFPAWSANLLSQI